MHPALGYAIHGVMLQDIFMLNDDILIKINLDCTSINLYQRRESHIIIIIISSSSSIHQSAISNHHHHHHHHHVHHHLYIGIIFSAIEMVQTTFLDHNIWIKLWCMLDREHNTCCHTINLYPDVDWWHINVTRVSSKIQFYLFMNFIYCILKQYKIRFRYMVSPNVKETYAS